MKKIWDYVIEAKEGFVLRKGNMYLVVATTRHKVQQSYNEQIS